MGKDVAMALGYAKPENALAAHVDKEDKTTTSIQGSGSNYKTNATIINESGLYSLILSSKLPDARSARSPPSFDHKWGTQHTTNGTGAGADALPYTILLRSTESSYRAHQIRKRLRI